MKGKTKKQPQPLVDALMRIEQLEKELKASRDEWVKEVMKGGEVISLKAENTQLKRRLELAELIVDGKQVEALACLFRKDVYVFAMDVRMDDSSYQAAKREIAAAAIAEHEAKKLKGGTWTANYKGNDLVATFHQTAG